MLARFLTDTIYCLLFRAAGYLAKNIPRHKLIEAIRMIHAGQGVFNLKASGGVLRKLTAGASGTGTGSSVLHRRELEVLKLVAKGMANKHIANELNISDNTVGAHLVSALLIDIAWRLLYWLNLLHHT